MKKLKQFQNFDYQRFLKGKTLMFLEYRLEDSEKFKGAKVQIMILDDQTIYDNQETNVNEFERFTLKIDGANDASMAQFKKKEKVKLENIKSATVWGDFSQNLTLTGEMRKVG